MIRFLHAADLHLDSPLRGLEKYEGAPVDRIRGASRRALENLVKLAIDERVHFVLVAGDVFDGDWHDVGTGLFFGGQMARLKEAGIPVFLIAGNHDAENKMSRRLPLPANVRMFPGDQPLSVPVGDLGVVIHGQSYAEQSETRNLALMYPRPVAGALNIGLLHTALTGRDGHEPYAPCLLDDLLSRGYHYWALGHIHQRESVHEANQPRVEFSGNLQGRHVQEAGAKGCLLVTAEGPRVTRVEFRPLDVVRWSRVRVSCEDVEGVDAVNERITAGLTEASLDADGRLLAARVELFGACDCHDELLARAGTLRDDVRALAQTLGGGAVWIEKVAIRTTSSRVATSEIADDALSEFSAVVRDLAASFESLQPLLDMDDLQALANKLPAEIKEGDAAVRLGDPAWAVGLLDRARAVLLDEAAARPVKEKAGKESK